MNRRDFSRALILFPVAITTGQLNPSSQLAASASETTLVPEIVAYTAKIQTYEAMLALQPGFSWYIHNELRHLYIGTNEPKAMEHSDAILAHSFMDNYVLSTLSDWQDDVDTARAILVLTNRAERFAYLPHLSAACLIKAADLSRTTGRLSEADAMYAYVITLGYAEWLALPTLKHYRVLAKMRLEGEVRTTL